MHLGFFSKLVLFGVFFLIMSGFVSAQYFGVGGTPIYGGSTRYPNSLYFGSGTTFAGSISTASGATLSASYSRNSFSFPEDVYPSYRAPFYSPGYYDYYGTGFMQLPSFVGYTVRDNYGYFYRTGLPSDYKFHFFPSPFLPDYFGPFNRVAPINYPVSYTNYSPIIKTQVFNESSVSPVTETVQDVKNFRSFFIPKNFFRGEITGKAFPEAKPRIQDISTGEVTPFPVNEKKEEKLVFESLPSSASCQGISVLDKSFSVKENESIQDTVLMQNNSSETFFVDNILLLNASEGISIGLKQFGSQIIPGKTFKVPVMLSGVEGFLNSSQVFSLKLLGHFEKGKSCGELRKDFSVTVLSGEKKDNLSLYQLSVPSKLSDKDSSFKVEVFNPLNKFVKVSFSGKGVSVDSQPLLVKPLTSVERSISFAATNSPEYIKIESQVDGEDIQNPKLVFVQSSQGVIEVTSYSKEVDLSKDSSIHLTLKNNSGEEKVVSIKLLEEQGIQASPVIVSIPGNELESVSLELDFPKKNFSSVATILIESEKQFIQRKVSLQFNASNLGLQVSSTPLIDGSYNLRVNLLNNSNEKVQGVIELSIPSTWIVSGQKTVELNPSESKELVLNVLPSEKLKEDYAFTVKFVKSNTGETIASTASLPVQGSSVATALISFTKSNILLGLIVLIIIGFVFARQDYVPYKKRKNLEIIHEYEKNKTFKELEEKLKILQKI